MSLSTLEPRTITGGIILRTRCKLTHFGAKHMSEAGLTTLQLDAARMVAMGINFSEIASELQLNRSTLYRWRQQEPFSKTVSQLVDNAARKGTEHMINDITDIKDVILGTLLDVAQNDSAGSARVSAARVLHEMVIRAEERADPDEVMKDQSEEIKSLLKLIQNQNKL